MGCRWQKNLVSVITVWCVDDGRAELRVSPGDGLDVVQSHQPARGVSRWKGLVSHNWVVGLADVSMWGSVGSLCWWLV